jgi:NitT/TauT family transport system substrate-binding protein/putative hydroxymethylpyrimidine transport system substrate-binding protein
VDDYGAPRYPELVLATRSSTLRDRPDLVKNALADIRHGTVVALRDRAATIERIARASGADPQLVRAQLDAVAPALVPPLRLDRRALEGWADFDARFGILKRPPDVGAAFPRP